MLLSSRLDPKHLQTHSESRAHNHIPTIIWHLWKNEPSYIEHWHRHNCVDSNRHKNSQLTKWNEKGRRLIYQIEIMKQKKARWRQQSFSWPITRNTRVFRPILFIRCTTAKICAKSWSRRKRGRGRGEVGIDWADCFEGSVFNSFDFFTETIFFAKL